MRLKYEPVYVQVEEATETQILLRAEEQMRRIRRFSCAISRGTFTAVAHGQTRQNSRSNYYREQCVPVHVFGA